MLLRHASPAADAVNGTVQPLLGGPTFCRNRSRHFNAASNTDSTSAASGQPPLVQPSPAGRQPASDGGGSISNNGNDSSNGNITSHADGAASGGHATAQQPPGLRSQIDTRQRGRSQSGRGSGGAATAGRQQPPPAAQLRIKPPRLQRSMDDGAEVDPLALPDMPQYQQRREPGAVGRSELLAAITSAQRWEDVAAVVDNRELDAVGLAAAFGHLAKLHAMAGPHSDMPRQLKSNGLVERLTERAAALAATRSAFPGRNVAAILAALPKLGVHPDEAHLLALSSAAGRALTTFAPGHAANAVRGFGALRFEPPGTLLTDLAAAAAARPAKLSPYNVGSLAWGCARLSVHPGEATLQALERRVLAADDFKAAHVAEALWGFGTLRHAPSQRTVAALLQAIVENEGKAPPFGFRGGAAAMTLSGIAKLGIVQPGLADGLPAGAATEDTGRGTCNHGSISNGAVVAAATGSAMESSPSSGQLRDGPPSISAAPGRPVGEALRVLVAALADGAADLSASQLAQALSALAQLPPAVADAARRPLLAAVAAAASSFPPPTVCKALTACEALAAAPAASEQQGSVRSRLAVMQTVDGSGSSIDEDKDDPAAMQHRLVAGLSSAQQALEDAQLAAGGESDSGEDEPQFLRSSDEGDTVEAFPLDGDFLLPAADADLSAAEGPNSPEAPQSPAAIAAATAPAAASQDEAAAALLALARQMRLTARRFEPAAMLVALRSFAALAAPAAKAEAGGASASAAEPAFVLPTDVVDALAGDIASRQLQFTKLQRSEAATLLGRLAAARGANMASVQALARTAQL